MKVVLVIFVLLTGGAVARADLGDTLEQCLARYGEPTERKPAASVEEMVYFKKEDLKIAVGLKGGKCVLLILGKETGDKLNEAEVQAFLKVNEGESVWKKNISSSANDVWSRADGYAVAQLGSITGILTLVTTEYMKSERARKGAGGG